MYLRKTTTTPMRGIDILEPLYARIMSSHKDMAHLDVLLIGAGVGVKILSKHTKTSLLFRRLDSLIRSFPLPSRYFSSYEPKELYQKFSEQGFQTRLRVADINPNVLSIVKQGLSSEQMAFELFDITQVAPMFIDELFDVCVVLNVLPHVRGEKKRRQAATNLIGLTRSGGYIVGAPIGRLTAGEDIALNRMVKVDKLLYQKVSHRNLKAQLPLG